MGGVKLNGVRGERWVDELIKRGERWVDRVILNGMRDGWMELTG